MSFSYSKHFLNRLEDVFSESDYHLRYEKGSFKSGYCILNDKKVAIVNKYFALEGKINALIMILREVRPSTDGMNPKNQQLLNKVLQTELEL